MRYLLFVDSACNLHNFVVLESLETVDYISKVNGDLIFRTSPKEKDKLVFQMGTASDENAVKVAKYVQNDVSAIGKSQTVLTYFFGNIPSIVLCAIFSKFDLHCL